MRLTVLISLAILFSGCSSRLPSADATQRSVASLRHSTSASTDISRAQAEKYGFDFKADAQNIVCRSTARQDDVFAYGVFNKVIVDQKTACNWSIDCTLLAGSEAFDRVKSDKVNDFPTRPLPDCQKILEDSVVSCLATKQTDSSGACVAR